MIDWIPAPPPGPEAAEAFVRDHLSHLVHDDVAGSERFRGGQQAADAALASFDVTGYAGRRNEVLPANRRGASALSPYIRHNLLTLAEVWDHVAGGPSKDVRKYRDELLWQEFARHWYLRHGTRTQVGIRRELGRDPRPVGDGLACVDWVRSELARDGWLVNQTRMWLAGHHSVREGLAWRDGEDDMFRQLLDGSRAANRLGWQWTTGVGSSKPYGFSRWQVQKRAPELCRRCPHANACPIEDWPDDPLYVDSVDAPARVGDAGPGAVEAADTPDTVWLTAESLGDADPALEANPALPAVFVFDEPLLMQLRLSAKRLVFLVETLSDLGTRREVEIAVGDPIEVLGDRRVAVTHAPVPGFSRRAAAVGPVEVHPYPWLRRPGRGSVSSFSAWRKSVGA